MELPRTSFKKLVLAIKSQCVECFGGQRSEVEHCTSPKCSLYPYRLGAKMGGRKGNAVSLKKV